MLQVKSSNAWISSWLIQYSVTVKEIDGVQLTTFHKVLVEKWEVIFPQIENKVLRGDIFLDVEICRRWSCYLLLQPLLLLLLSMIVVVKIATSNFYSKQSKKIKMDELRTRNHLSIKWTLRQNSKEWMNKAIQFERWTCKQLEQLNPHEARTWWASRVHVV